MKTLSFLVTLLTFGVAVAEPQKGREITGIEVKALGTIYSAASVCFISPDDKVVYINEVYKKGGGSVYLIYVMEDKSTIEWERLMRRFDFKDLERRLGKHDHTKEDVAIAKSRNTKVVTLFFSDGTTHSFRTRIQPEIVEIFDHVDTLGWSLIRQNIPKIKEFADDFDLFDDATKTVLETLKEYQLPEGRQPAPE